MTTTTIAPELRGGLTATANAVRHSLGAVPLPLIELLMRIGIALVFWKSGMTKLANWDLTVALFANEYQVPVLSPDLAALLATSAELACPILIAFGLFARLGAAGLLGMTYVIQIFVFPENWSEHLLWAAILLYVLTRGAGLLSIDNIIARRLLGGSGS